MKKDRREEEQRRKKYKDGGILKEHRGQPKMIFNKQRIL